MNSVTRHTRRIARLAPPASDWGSDALAYVVGAVGPGAHEHRGAKQQQSSGVNRISLWVASNRGFRTTCHRA